MSDVVIENSSSPVPALSLATPDNLTIVGHGIHDDPLRAIGIGGPTSGPAALVASTNLIAGEVIAPSLTAGTARPAKADGTILGNAIGIVTSPTGTAEAEVIEYSLIAGLISLVASVWDAVTGGSGGLVRGDVYYLSQATAGHLTNVKPSSGQIVQIGTAISTTTLALGTGQPTTPGSSTSSAEHVTTAGNVAVANPAVDVTFVTLGGGADAGQTINLANGTTDGQPKEITLMPNDGIAAVSWQIVCASGPTLVFPHSAIAQGGGASLRWDATAIAWRCVGIFGNA